MATKQVYNHLKKSIEVNDLEEIKKVFRRHDAKLILDYADDLKYTALMWACKTNYNRHEVSVPLLQLFFDEIKRIGGDSSSNNSNRYLKEQLSNTNTDGWNCLVFALRYGSDVKLLQLFFDTILDVGRDAFLLDQLQPQLKYGGSCLSMILSNESATYDMMTLLVSNLVKFGIFKQNFSGLDNEKKRHLKKFWVSENWTPEMIPFGGVIDAAHRNDHEAISMILRNAPSKFELLKMAPEEFYGRSILLHVCCDIGSKGIKVETVELLLDIIFRIGGEEFFSSQVTRTNKTGWHCLMNLCLYSPSGGYIRMFLEKVLEYGNRRLLRSLVKKNEEFSIVPLVLAVGNAVKIGAADLRLVASVVAEAGLFRQQYSNDLSDIQREHVLKPNGIYSADWSWKESFVQIKARVMERAKSSGKE